MPNAKQNWPRTFILEPIMWNITVEHPYAIFIVLPLRYDNVARVRLHACKLENRAKRTAPFQCKSKTLRNDKIYHLPNGTSNANFSTACNKKIANCAPIIWKIAFRYAKLSIAGNTELWRTCEHNTRNCDMDQRWDATPLVATDVIQRNTQTNKLENRKQQLAQSTTHHQERRPKVPHYHQKANKLQ